MNIRDAFENFKNECEKYAKDGLPQVVIELKGFTWQKEVFEKLVEIYKLEAEVDHLTNILLNDEKNVKISAYHIMKNSLHSFQTQPELELDIVKGEFVEGNRVIVSVNGDQVERVVKYSRDAGDLYITYKNNKYFYYEFYK